MPLKKILFKPGVNRENTRYTTEGGWYECDKIRFRQGTPEKIGGWVRIATATFQGICRSLWNWVTLGGANLIGVGTNLKFYIYQGGLYYDVTPLRSTVTLTNPFSTALGSATVTVTDTAHGGVTGDFVTFTGATAVGGLDLNNEYQITVIDVDTYTITASSAATSTATGGGTVTAAYQINIGSDISIPVVGWGAGGWGLGEWGIGEPSVSQIRLWSQSNFGEDLVFNPRGGPLYLWTALGSVATRAVPVTGLPGASDVPVVVNISLVSDVSRFVFALGCNEIGQTQLDPMLIRWSDQESLVDWTPAATNQAGSLRLSQGSRIVAAIQSRQEILVWTDAAVYSLQNQGPPVGWGAQLVGENVSIVSPNAAVIASGAAYWMGIDKFYKYDGRTQTLRCDLRQHIFSNINPDQYDQIICGTNEGFNEVWWFYCSKNSTVVDLYAVYNYGEDIWYYGSLGRTAWLDSGLQDYPMAATYANTLVYHEYGTDDNSTEVPAPIEAYITSSEFDIDDGHQFAFVWRVLPDITFRNSTVSAPSATMYMLPLKNSGSGYVNETGPTSNQSVGYFSYAAVVQGSAYPIEQFTGQIFTRVRGRQLAIRIGSTDLGVTWQLGAPRIDWRPDGRR